MHFVETTRARTGYLGLITEIGEVTPAGYPSSGPSRVRFGQRDGGKGSAMAMGLEAFLRRVDRTGTCWLWTGYVDKDGYGRAGRKGVHRLSWELHYGQIPLGTGPHGTCVLHRCDNPRCVRPDHLFLGSNAENMADRNRKARQASGEKNGRAKLSRADVAVIKSNLEGCVPIKELASRFSVSVRAISLIHSGKNWGTVSQ